MEFQYNDKTYYTTQQTPFFLNNGYHSWKGELILDDENPSAEDFLKWLQQAQEEAIAAMTHNQNNTARKHNIQENHEDTRLVIKYG